MATGGKLFFQAKDRDGNAVGEPWTWPEGESASSYESPQIVENDGQTWLTFVERSPDGTVRSRTISLSEIFANGFEAGTTAAWTSTEPAVNLTIEVPAEEAAVGDATPGIRALFATPTGIAIAPETLAFTSGGSALTVSCVPISGGAECVPSVPFADGPVTLRATVADVAGHVSPVALRRFTVDTAAPTLSLSAPAEGFLTGETTVMVAGSVSEAATLTISGVPVAVAPGLTFAAEAPLAEGANVLIVTATDAAGNAAVVERHGVSDTLAPAPVSAALVATGRSGAKVSIVGAAGAAEGEATVRWRNPRTLQEVEVGVAADGSFATSIGGADGDVLTAIVVDFFGRESLPAYFPVDYLVPPDPAPFAPPLDPTVAYDLGDAIGFLYQGEHAVQKDVAPGAIEERRIAWLRGTVRQRGGAPLAGARVSVLGHPELGFTLSRADGVFDLVVNGGGVVTLDFERAGFLPIQRQEKMAWRGSTVIDDVVLIGLDPIATEIESGSAEGQIARSTPQDDGDGAREAIIFFPPGTTASLRMPDGSTTPASSLKVRATEYTVGLEGWAAMPGPLPANVAYTYAVELSADEAIAARAEHVLFSQPVYLYVDSFIPFPVGSPVPLAWYDRKSARWIPADNGRVLEILSVNGEGLAEIDVAGEGEAAGEQALAELGFTASERRKMAEIYAPGSRIWRSPIPHFTPWDTNFPYSPADDAEEPPAPTVKTNDDEPDGDQHDDDGSDEDESPVKPVTAADDPNCRYGSIIECENQIVRQEYPVVGTPYRLAYSSQRTPAWEADFTSEVPLIGFPLPASLQQIHTLVVGHGLRLEAQFDREQFEGLSQMSWSFKSPKFDTFGRLIPGQREFTVGLGYRYPAVYRTAPEFERSWARFPDATAERITGSGPRYSIALWKLSQGTYNRLFPGTLGTWDGRFQKLGGFTLDVHHAYDPVARTLYRGDGSRRSANAVAPTLRRVAGSGEGGFGGDGGPATLAQLNSPGAMDVAADGSLYFSDAGNHRIRVVRPDGTIETVAGSGETCTTGGPGGPGDGLGGEEEPPPSCDDGIPATSARLGFPAALDIGPDGSLYFADQDQSCVYRVDPQGILHVFAGICLPGVGGGGGPGSRPAPAAEPPSQAGPATESELQSPYALAVTTQGIVYIADDHGLSQVTPDGTLARLAEPASIVIGLTAGANGELFILDQLWKISRMLVDGKLETIAGGGEDPGLDGDPALGAFLVAPTHLSYGRDGRLYFVEDGVRIRRIETDGTLATIAGTKPATDGMPASGPPQEGGFLLGNQFYGVKGIAAGPTGNLLIADALSAQIFESQVAFPDYIEDELNIAEGGQVYVFDDRGRHLRTRHGLTGATIYQFGYDRQGLLVSIEDASGNTTTIEREGSGAATAIVSPFGQRTELVIDGEGWLESIENPNQETYRFLYRLGKMTEARDPRGHKKTYEYSELGRLVATADEEEERRTLSLIGRYGWPDSTVTLMGADNQKTQYTTRNRPDGSVYRSTRNPDGMVSISYSYRDGSTETEDRGTLSYMRRRPDPRLGEGSAYPAHSWIYMAEGLRSETRTSVDTTLADPADPWSFEDIATVSETNGRLTSSLYTAETRSLVTVSPEGRAVSLELDHLARPIRFEAPDTQPWSATYGETGEVEEIAVGTGSEARKTIFGDDLFRRLDTIEDAEERIVSFTYDDANRVVATVLPDQKTVGFSYDANGNVESVTPPGRPAHVFTYTKRNQLETYTLPDAGSGAAVEQRVYDESRRLEKVIRADQKEISFEYQAHSDRLESIHSPRGTTHFEFDPTTGLVSEIEEPDGQKLAFEYEGLLLKKTTWTGEVNGSVGRTYDNNFRVTSIDVNGQDPIAYQYDDDNLLIQVGDMTITRDPESGRELTTQLGNVTTERTYTSFGEPESYTAKFNATEIYYERYTYNKLGWITDLERRQNGFNENLHYEYDDRGRLEEVWRDGSLESSYTYDDNSNRLSYTGPLGNATGTYDARDRMLTYGGATYTWTEAGELLTKTEGGYTTTYDYDVFGNLRKVELPDGIEIEYLTDGAQRRIGKKINGVLVKQWLYQDQLEPVAELDDSGSVKSRYLYGLQRHAPDSVLTADSFCRYIADQTGSLRLVVNVADGKIVSEFRYDEFGGIILNAGGFLETSSYSGGSFDESTNLILFGARDYDAKLGRWTNADPASFYGGNPNQYQYAFLDPVNRIDPSGEIPLLLPLVTGGVGAASGIVANLAVQALGGGKVDWGSAMIAGGTGFLAGAAAPFVATTMTGAVVLGALSNMGQYIADQVYHDEPITWTGAGLNALSGAVAGRLAGPNVPAGRFDATSPWLDGGIAARLNEMEDISYNTAASNMGRNVLGGFLSNVDYETWLQENCPWR